MTSGPTNGVLRHMRRAALAHDDGERTDGQLLARFLDLRDEAAFELLLVRHGPMVLGVCRRLLGNHADADDAFQAVFLILLRKAAGFRARRTVGDWLYGVAYNTALKARAATVKRRHREHQVRPPVETVDDDCTAEMLSLLDRELLRLPEQYRAPVVLCELKGQSRKETARQLGIPEGTLSSRLATARKMLAKRLARYGLAITGGTLAALLTPKTATAGVPDVLASATLDAATAGATPAVAALVEGVLKAMLMTKLKIGAALVLVFGLVLGGAATWLLAEANVNPPEQPNPPLKGDVNKATTYQVRFVGPAEAKTGRLADGDKARQEMPCRLTFDKPGTYRLKLTDVPNRPGLELYPTIEVYPATPQTAAYLANSAIPVEFLSADVDLAASGKVATKVVCLVDDAIETITPKRADVDVVAIAKKKGPILLVVRLGSIDLEAPKPAEDDAYRAAVIAALHHFAAKGDLHHVKAVLDKHPDLLDAKPIFRQPHKPSRGDDFTPLIAAVEEGCDEVAAYLLSKGAKVQASDWLQGWTPLHIAARRGDVATAKVLIKYGAKLDAKDESDRTPQDVAVKWEKPEMVDYLKSLRK